MNLGEGLEVNTFVRFRVDKSVSFFFCLEALLRALYTIVKSQMSLLFFSTKNMPVRICWFKQIIY